MGTDVRNDLQSTQDAYRQKLQDTREEDDAELARLKKNHAKQMTEERAAGEASVNHIREGNKSEVDSLRNEGEQKITYERAAYDKRIQDAKKNKQDELKELHRSLNTAEADLERQQKQAAEREAAVSEHEQSTTTGIEKREAAARTKAIQREQEDLEKARDRVSSIKEKIAESNALEIQKMKQQNAGEMAAIKKEHEEALQRTTQQDDTQIHAEHDKVAKELDQDQKQFSTRDADIRNRAKAVEQQESDRDNQRLTSLKKKNQEDFNKERVRGSTSAEKTHQYYAAEVEQINNQGTEEVNKEKQQNDKRLTDEQMSYKTESEKKSKHYEADRKRAFEVYRNQMAHDDAFYKKSLKEQRKEFERLYSANYDDDMQILDNTKQKMTAELLKQKAEVTDDLDKYRDKRDDTFYRMKSIDYRLHDTGDFYVLRAQIPEAERNNVKVVLKENKIVLQGQRRFEDHINQPDHKLSTENYQSFRDEIPLEHPVQERYATREWKDGVLTLKVPKA